MYMSEIEPYFYRYFIIIIITRSGYLAFRSILWIIYEI